MAERDKSFIVQVMAVLLRSEHWQGGVIGTHVEFILLD
jgi:hypothetical protein